MRKRRKQTRKARDVKVALTLELGISVRETADLFGLSPARVSQIGRKMRGAS